MPKKSKRDFTLIAALIFASITISSSVVFVGWQLSSSGNVTISQDMIRNAVQELADNAQQKEITSPAGEVIKPNKDDHLKGNKDARITLIEFSDFECPFCKSFHSTPQELLDYYDGQVNWVYRHFPLQFHDPLATLQAIATECVADLAGDDAFWDYSNRIFQTTKSNGNGMAKNDLIALAKEFSINETDFNACIDSDKFRQDIQNDIQDGIKAGVGGTPGTIIFDNKTNTKTLIEGSQPSETFKDVIDQMLQTK